VVFGRGKEKITIGKNFTGGKRGGGAEFHIFCVIVQKGGRKGEEGLVIEDCEKRGGGGGFAFPPSVSSKEKGGKYLGSTRQKPTHKKKKGGAGFNHEAKKKGERIIQVFRVLVLGKKKKGG